MSQNLTIWANYAKQDTTVHSHDYTNSTTVQSAAEMKCPRASHESLSICEHLFHNFHKYNHYIFFREVTVSIEVVFSSIFGSGHNLIIMIRQDHPGSSQRQTEPVVGTHHKLIPIKKSDHQNSKGAVTWSYQPKANNLCFDGPFSDLRTRQTFYTCEYGHCLVGCPCSKCLGEVKDTCGGLEEHMLYHHVPHVDCEFCSQLLNIFPTFSYTKERSIGPFYDPKYVFVRWCHYFKHVHQIDNGTKFKKLECEVCAKVFKKVSHKKQHYLQHHYEASFTCEVCHKNFGRKDTMLSHMASVHSEKTFFCAHCDSEFSRKSNLMRHYEKFHSKNKSPEQCCDYCGDTFATLRLMQKHKRQYHKRFECARCKKSFSTKITLSIHSSRTSVQCDLCDSVFCNNAQLKAHSGSVHEGDEYKCEICAKKFTRKFSLTYHIKKRVKSFCDLCGKELCNERHKFKHTLFDHKLKSNM